MPTPSASWVETISFAPAIEVEQMLWRRVEVLEFWAAKAWIACGIK